MRQNFETLQWQGADAGDIGALPADTDAKSGRADQIAEMRDAVRIGAEVRNGGGNGVDPGAKGERQAEQGGMIIESVWDLARGHDFHARIKRLENSGEAFLRRHHHLSAPVRDERRITAELDRVTQPLL